MKSKDPRTNPCGTIIKICFGDFDPLCLVTFAAKIFSNYKLWELSKSYQQNIKLALKKANILQHTKSRHSVDRRSSFSVLDSSGNFSLGTRY